VLDWSNLLEGFHSHDPFPDTVDDSIGFASDWTNLYLMSCKESSKLIKINGVGRGILIYSWCNDMNTEIRDAKAQGIDTTEDELIVRFVDGRTISIPLAWYPRLYHATQEERANWRLIGDGNGIHWPDLDEDINVDHLLAGIPSTESQRSLQKWLQERNSV
jgi:hypothetical protein